MRVTDIGSLVKINVYTVAKWFKYLPTNYPKGLMSIMEYLDK